MYMHMILAECPTFQHNPEPEKSTKSRFGTFKIKGGFFIAKFITID